MISKIRLIIVNLSYSVWVRNLILLPWFCVWLIQINSIIILLILIFILLLFHTQIILMLINEMLLESLWVLSQVVIGIILRTCCYNHRIILNLVVLKRSKLPIKRSFSHLINLKAKFMLIISLQLYS